MHFIIKDPFTSGFTVMALAADTVYMHRSTSLLLEAAFPSSCKQVWARVHSCLIPSCHNYTYEKHLQLRCSVASLNWWGDYGCLF